MSKTTTPNTITIPALGASLREKQATLHTQQRRQLERIIELAQQGLEDFPAKGYVSGLHTLTPLYEAVASLRYTASREDQLNELIRDLAT